MIEDLYDYFNAETFCFPSFYYYCITLLKEHDIKIYIVTINQLILYTV